MLYWIIHLVQAAQYLLFRGPYGNSGTKNYTFSIPVTSGTFFVLAFLVWDNGPFPADVKPCTAMAYSVLVMRPVIR